jgi:hypothetical protein
MHMVVVAVRLFHSGYSPHPVCLSSSLSIYAPKQFLLQLAHPFCVATGRFYHSWTWSTGCHWWYSYVHGGVSDRYVPFLGCHTFLDQQINADRLGIMPLGSILGKGLPSKFSMLGSMAATFVLGFACTLAEPAMGALELAGWY